MLAPVGIIDLARMGGSIERAFGLPFNPAIPFPDSPTSMFPVDIVAL